jgi:WD40 repeat protein
MVLQILIVLPAPCRKALSALLVSAIVVLQNKRRCPVGHDKTVKLWDARTGNEFRTLRGHPDCEQSVAFAANGQNLA